MIKLIIAQFRYFKIQRLDLCNTSGTEEVQKEVIFEDFLKPH